MTARGQQASGVTTVALGDFAVQGSGEYTITTGLSARLSAYRHCVASAGRFGHVGKVFVDARRVRESMPALESAKEHGRTALQRHTRVTFGPIRRNTR